MFHARTTASTVIIPFLIMRPLRHFLYKISREYLMPHTDMTDPKVFDYKVSRKIAVFIFQLIFFVVVLPILQSVGIELSLLWHPVHECVQWTEEKFIAVTAVAGVFAAYWMEDLTYHWNDLAKVIRLHHLGAIMAAIYTMDFAPRMEFALIAGVYNCINELVFISLAFYYFPKFHRWIKPLCAAGYIIPYITMRIYMTYVLITMMLNGCVGTGVALAIFSIGFTAVALSWLDTARIVGWYMLLTKLPCVARAKKEDLKIDYSGAPTSEGQELAQPKSISIEITEIPEEKSLGPA